MAELRGSAAIDLVQLPSVEGIEPMGGGSRVTYWRKSQNADVEGLRRALEAAADGRYEVLSEETQALRGHGPGPRTPVLVIETTPPAFFSRGPVEPDKVAGTHGYPATVVDMGALFIAAGPAFKQGVVLDEIHQLDVYPVAAKVLDVKPLMALPSDGGALNAALK
jgi:hypothetical protein